MPRRPEVPDQAERKAAEERSRAERARQERLKELDADHESLMGKLGRPFEDLFRRRRRPSGP
jgi:hypothetical protein